MTAIGSLVVSNGLIGLGPDARAAWEQTKKVSFACNQVAPSLTDVVLLISADTTCKNLGQWVETAKDTGGGTMWSKAPNSGGAVVLVETDYMGDQGAKVVITNNPQTVAQLAGAPAGTTSATPAPGRYAIAEAASSPDAFSVTLLASNIAQGKGKVAVASMAGGGALLVAGGLAAVVLMILSGGKKRRRR
jgi:hypothetical protein